jgi:hypothetical protein
MCLLVPLQLMCLRQPCLRAWAPAERDVLTHNHPQSARCLQAMCLRRPCLRAWVPRPAPLSATCCEPPPTPTPRLTHYYCLFAGFDHAGDVPEATVLESLSAASGPAERDVL